MERGYCFDWGWKKVSQFFHCNLVVLQELPKQVQNVEWLDWRMRITSIGSLDLVILGEGRATVMSFSFNHFSSTGPLFFPILHVFSSSMNKLP